MNRVSIDQKASLRKVVVVTILKYGLGFALLGYLIWMNRGELVKLIETPKRPEPFLFACSLMLAALLLTFIRWYILVRAVNLPFTILNALRLGLVGYFLSTFLPGSIGGDIVKAAFIAREQQRRTAAVSTVLIDRGVGLWGLCWFVTLLGGLFWYLGELSDKPDVLKRIVVFATVIVAVTLSIWILLGFLPQWRADRFAGRLTRLPKVGRAASEFWRAVWMYRLRSKSFWLALVLAVIGHVGFVLTFYFAARTLFPVDQVPPLVAHFMIVPIGMAVQAIPLTPGGLGVGEAAFGELYHLVGYDPSYGIFAAFVQRVINWILGFIGYLVYLQMRPALRTTAATVEEPETIDEVNALAQTSGAREALPDNQVK
jgi:uncharacterized protein (TIRG00374 family)